MSSCSIPSTAVAEERLTMLASSLHQFQQQCLELQRMVNAVKVDSASSGRLLRQLALVDEMSARLGLALSEGTSMATQQFQARHAKLHRDYRTVNQHFAEIKALAASKVQSSEFRNRSTPDSYSRDNTNPEQLQRRALVSARKHDEVNIDWTR